MDTQVLVKEALSSEMIDAGKELIQQLDKINFMVHAGLWLYLSDVNAWRFVIANPEVKTRGPKKAYGKVQDALSRIREGAPRIALREITVIDTDDPLISSIRVAIKRGKEISGMRFSHNILNGTLIEDSYIYRML